MNTKPLERAVGNTGKIKPGGTITAYKRSSRTTVVRRTSWYALVILLFTLASCSKDPETGGPLRPPEPGQVYTLKYKATEVIEFKQILNGTVVSDLSSEKQNDLFGSRMKFACPSEIRLSKDSLTILKPGGISEQYKVKLENNELFLYNDVLSAWEYGGKKDSGTQIILNTAFFIKTSTNNMRQLSVSGQEYSLRNYSSLVSADDKEGSDIKWLKVQYSFE